MQFEKVAPAWFSVSVSTFVASIEAVTLNNPKMESRI